MAKAASKTTPPAQKAESAQDSAPESRVETPETHSVSETIIEEYPAGMSVEQMRKSNPEAVTAIENAAVTAAQVKTPATIEELKVAFKDNPQIALDAAEAGFTVMEAKAGQYDTLVEQVSTLTAENKDLKSKVDNSHVTYSEATDSNGGQVSGNLEELSDDELEAAAVEYWNNHEQVREGHGTKAAFCAYFKNRPEEFQK